MKGIWNDLRFADKIFQQNGKTTKKTAAYSSGPAPSSGTPPVLSSLNPNLRPLRSNDESAAMRQVLEKHKTAQPQPIGVETSRSKEPWEKLRSQTIKKYFSKNLKPKDTLGMLRQDLENLKLEAQKPAPTWTTKERADLESWLLNHQAVVQGDANKKRWKTIAWDPTIVWNFIVNVVFSVFWFFWASCGWVNAVG